VSAWPGSSDEAGVRNLAVATLTLLLSATPGLADETARDWSGPYVGAYAGAGLGQLDVKFDGIHPADTDLDGFAGGGLAGWNLQFGSVVVGLEGDLGLSAQHGTIEGSVTLGPPDPPGPYHYTDKFYKNWEAHLRARVGWACGDLQVFAAGGLAVAGIEFGYQSIHDGSYDWDSETLLGWTAGAGLDYAVDESFSVRLEYLYDDYGSAWYFDHRDSVDLTTHSLRLAIAYGF
jgi:outer membrane immunogenic protein